MIIRDSKGKVTGIRVLLDGKAYTIDKTRLFMPGYRVPDNVLAMAAGEAATDPEAAEFLRQCCPGLKVAMR